MSTSAACLSKSPSVDVSTPLPWIPEELSFEGSGAQTVSSLRPIWYLGGRDISSWSASINLGLSIETSSRITQRVEWMVKAILANLKYLKEEISKETKELCAVALKYEGEVHNLFAFQNTLLFNLPKVTSGSFKTAIPMVDLETGKLLMRLRVNRTLDFDYFAKEIEIQKKLAGPNILSILGSTLYNVKKPKEKHDDPRVDKKHRYCILTPVYRYSLENLCQTFCLTEFTKVCLALKIAKALKSIHDQGYTHNDLKTRNVFVDPIEGIVIGDFGLSLPLNSPEKESYLARVEADLREGRCLLDKKERELTTSHIKAPELHRTYFTPASDIFAYGMILLELCGKKSLFSFDVYHRDRFYNSRIREKEYNERLDEVLSQPCAFNCLENIARMALSFQANDRPSIETLLELLKELYDSFSKSQQSFLPLFKGVSPLAELYLFHTSEWKNIFSPRIPLFSSFGDSFSLWINHILQKSLLQDLSAQKYLRKARLFFEEFTCLQTELEERIKSITSPIFYVGLSNGSQEFLGRALVYQSEILYRSPPVFENKDIRIRETHNITTGEQTDLIVITARSVMANQNIKLLASLTDEIRQHPATIPFGFIFYESKKDEPISDTFLRTSTKRKRASKEIICAQATAKKIQKVALVYPREVISYLEALKSPEKLTQKNLIEWTKQLTHFLSLLHEQGVFLGKIKLTQLGMNKLDQLVITQLINVVKKSEVEEWKTRYENDQTLTIPDHYLSLFQTFICEEEDVKNLGMLLLIFTHQHLHPKPVESKQDYKAIMTEFFSLSNQKDLDRYLDQILLPHKSDKTPASDFCAILRKMISVDPRARLSSKAAYEQFLALSP